MDLEPRDTTAGCEVMVVATVGGWT
jgi:hypothetical protein